MSAAPAAAQAPASAASRRTRYAATTIVLVAAATIIAILAAAIGSRYHARFDLTAAREHSLAPRTVAILAALRGPVEIVVSADLPNTDVTSLQRGVDLLTVFQNASPKVTSTIISTADAAAPARFDEIVGRIATNSSDDVESHTRAVEAYLTDLSAIADLLDGLAASAASLREKVGEAHTLAASLSNAATQLPQLAAALREARAQADRDAWLDVDGARLAQGDVAQQIAAALLTRSASFFDAVIRQFGDVLADDPNPEISAAARALRTSAQKGADLAATAADRLARLTPLDPVVAHRLLGASQTILLVSPTGISAVGVDALFAPPGAGGATPLDLRARAEELIATGIAAIDDVRRPIVVLVHAHPARMLDGANAPNQAAASRIGAAVQRLASQRIDITEWATLIDEHPPDLTGLDPERRRPVVWAIQPPLPTGASITQASFGLARLSSVITQLLDAGENLLVSFEPSREPALGIPDVLAEPFTRLGLTIDTGRPLISEISHPTQSVISTYQVTRNIATGHPVADAVAGLAMSFHFAMPIRIAAEAATGIRAHPLILTEPATISWAESQWSDLRLANEGRPFRSLPLTNPPAPDPQRDDTAGPWTIAAAVERDRDRVSTPELRTSPAASGPQRIVAVAAPSWYDNAVVLAGAAVEGRSIAAYPGNLELFENSIAWLAERDELVAAGSISRDVPRIGPLTPSQVSIIRWSLIGGLPLLVLTVGAALRIIRG